jgi:2-iminobutanoate/2-iminopropanoate deaminase
VKEIFEPAGVPTLPYFSPVLRAGDFVFVSGMAGLVPGHEPTGEGEGWSPGKLAEGGLAAQTRQALENIKNALAGAGASLADVVKVTTYLRDVDLFYHEYNAVYLEYFPSERPTRTTIGAKIYGPILIEMDCVAFAPQH